MNGVTGEPVNDILAAVVDTLGRQLLVAKLAQLRDERRLSQRWLAGALGVSQGAVSEWVRGITRPLLAPTLALRALLGIPLEAWMTERERMLHARAELVAHDLLLRPPPPKTDKKQVGRKPLSEPDPEIDPRQLSLLAEPPSTPSTEETLPA